QIALETGNEDVEVKLVNSALVSIHIDGYKVSNPISFQGRDVADWGFTGCCSRGCYWRGGGGVHILFFRYFKRSSGRKLTRRHISTKNNQRP
ncbi:hypothetical protein EUA73_01255, partial [TM7 phylum sp. oral taxon 352]